MKKSGIFLLIISIFLVGVVAAEPAIPKVNEVQGLSTSTTVIAAGNFNGASSVDLTISSVVPVTGIPGPEWTNDTAITGPPANLGATVYQTVYTEDTQNSEVGFISYDKDLDVSTGNKVSGQYNVQAVKQITYLGVDASSLVTNDYMLLDGAGWPGYAGDRTICPFAKEFSFSPMIGVNLTGPYVYPAFCNRVETGSSMNLKVADLNTQMADRFIMKSVDAGVTVLNNVGVSSYAADLPSRGSVSAYIRGSIREGGRFMDYTSVKGIPGDTYGPFDDLYETVTFSDSTGISGDISTFAKAMSYTSVIDVSGDRVNIPIDN